MLIIAWTLRMIECPLFYTKARNPKISRLQNIEELHIHYAIENHISLACRLHINQMKGEAYAANFSGGKVQKSNWRYL